MRSRGKAALKAGLLALATVAAAIAGAFVFRALDLPLAYILGALAGSAVVANAVAPMKGGRILRRAGQLFVGTSVGVLLTPEVAAELARLLPAMLAVALASNAAGVALAVPVAWIAGTDRLTGLLSCLPAGMAEMASLARDLGANEQTVAIVHTLRVILVLTLVPLWLGLSAGAPAPAAPAAFAGAGGVLLVAAAAGLIAAAASRLGVLNPWVIAPMLLCLALIAAGERVPAVPPPILVAAQIAIGASLGLRLRLRDFRTLPRAALAGLVSGLLLIALAVTAFAGFVRMASGLDRASAALAVAPGGLGEMIASAGALGLSAAAVAGFQITRSILTNIFTPPLIRLLAKRRSGGRPSPD